ncbi:MAG: DUF2461 domain-containing protein [Acidimicrobiia bacterium]
MAFRGWPVEAIEFFEGLEADNSRTYWQANKAVYEGCVRAPMEGLLAELEREFGEGKIFRPYRDVRFSADKSPYKTAIAASLGAGGYVQLSTEGLGAGCGMYMMAKDQLERFRAAVADDRTGRRLVTLVESTRDRGIDVTAHDSLKTAPRGYPKDHPRADLLRFKGLVAWKQWPVGAWLDSGKAKGRIVELLRAAKPLQRWLDGNVGPSELADGR